MVFSSLVFLFVFLPLVLLLYFIVPFKFKNIVLLVFSLFFYAWGEPVYIFLMLISIVVNYVLGIWVEKKRKLSILWIGIAINLLILGYYKYYGFLIELINDIFSTDLLIKELALPIGISFYTFQAISYLVDVYRKDTAAQRNLFDLAVFISLFPQLVAGPIVKYKEISEQIKHRTHSVDMFYDGLKIFLMGLAKKVLLANQFALLADTIFAKSDSELTFTLAWIGIIAYTLQIYFDFSGYSEMAVGLGKMFGFTFPRNFNYPYISQSVSEFWRRWHMTLGSFFREYVYIPLGGNRVSKFKLYRNLFIVWLLTGIWHGAAFTFIVWGLFYGTLIALERGPWGKILEKLPRVCRHLYVIFAFVLGWVVFRAESIEHAFMYYAKMFSFDLAYVKMDLSFYANEYLIVLIAGVILSTPIYPKLMSKVNNDFKIIIESCLIMILFLVVILSLATSSYNPFIYFRF
ncbi:MAG: MBOAT family O-acyltransferase [Solibacillus sp.]